MDGDGDMGVRADVQPHRGHHGPAERRPAADGDRYRGRHLPQRRLCPIRDECLQVSCIVLEVSAGSS